MCTVFADDAMREVKTVTRLLHCIQQQEATAEYYDRRNNVFNDYIPLKYAGRPHSQRLWR